MRVFDVVVDVAKSIVFRNSLWNGLCLGLFDVVLDLGFWFGDISRS